MVAQWTWNLRLELGHLLQPSPLRITEFAPAMAKARSQAAMHPALPAVSAPVSGYGPATAATRLGKPVASPEPTFLSSPTGRCAVQQGSRLCPRSIVERLIAACAWCMPEVTAIVVPARCESLANGMVTPPKSRARSACSCIRSLSEGSRFSGRTGAEESIDVPVSTSFVRSRVEIEVQRGVGPPTVAPHVTSAPLSRAERAHTRLSWVQRLVRNAHPQTTRQITIRLFGVPAGFATSLSLASG